MIKHIAIIGSGAIGSLWAHHLALKGYQVTLIGRQQKQHKQISTLLMHRGQEVTQSIDYLNNQLPPTLDLVLVMTKAYQIIDAITPYLDSLKTCPIVLMHNGLGAVEQLPLTEQHSVYLATTSHGALKNQDGVEHTGTGQTMIGCYGNASAVQAQSICQVLNNALPPVEYVQDINAALWKKLAINCAINPLTAINQCRNGDLSNPKYTQQLDTIIKEISLLTERLNIDLSYQSMRETVNIVIHNTAKNFSSMHQDVLNGRETEIDFINGHIVNMGKELGIPTPENEKLWRAINTL